MTNLEIVRHAREAQIISAAFSSSAVEKRPGQPDERRGRTLELGRPFLNRLFMQDQAGG